MDESLFFLAEAYDYLDQYVEISDLDAIMEATDKAKEANANNEKAGDGALNAIKNAIQSLINLVKNSISAVVNFIQEAFMSRDQRAKFNAFKQKMAKDKRYAGKKIRVSDFREYEKQYDNAISRIDKIYRNGGSADEAEAVMAELNGTLRNLKKAAKGGASAGVTTMTLQAALELADRNMVAAKGIQKALESENGLLQAIADSVGDNEAARFKKKVDNYARDGVFHRMKVNLLCRKQKDLVAVGQSLIKNITSFFKVDAAGNVSVTKGSFMNGVYRNAGTINAVMKGTNPDGEKPSVKNLMGRALHGANTARKANDFVNDAKKLF